MHEVVKSELIRLGVNQEYINPPLGESAGELKLSGLLKYKNQDICVTRNNIEKVSEILSSEGILYGQEDVFGKEFTEKTLSVNVRSQLSSFTKNFDTLYERTFAEALNLHLRCEEMVLGEFYMIAVNEYDSDSAKNKQVEYRRILGIDKHIEKYLLSFSAINGRNDIANHHYKYERVCLLIVDFSRPAPKIYNTDDELRADGLLSDGSLASINNLSFTNFIAELLQTYNVRFGEGRFI